ncbi:MAG: UbiA family prenyltransferase, partial [Haliscomenobacter sp.]
MQEVKVQEATFTALVAQKVEDFKLLVKFRLSLTVVFSSLMGFLIAARSGVQSWSALGMLALGGFLVTAAANTLNQVLEKDYDRLMQRTANRPLAAGRMRNQDAVLLAGIMSLLGISILAMFNPWTAFLGMVALLMYSSQDCRAHDGYVCRSSTPDRNGWWCYVADNNNSRSSGSRDANPASAAATTSIRSSACRIARACASAGATTASATTSTGSRRTIVISCSTASA